MTPNFDLYAKYYNLLYADKDYGAEVTYLDGLLKSYAPAAKSILEFGSGTGRHGLLLQQQGYVVLGLERSESMVAEARQRGFDCSVADISDFELDRSFDAVISLFHVVSYLVANDALVRSFQNARRHLNPGGVFIFDVWYTPAVYAQGAETRLKKMQNQELAVTRIAEPKKIPNSNVIDVQFTVIAKNLQTGEVSEFVESHPMRHFSIPEVELLARLTGFEIIRAEAFLTAEAPSEHTWGVCFMLKKI